MKIGIDAGVIGPSIFTMLLVMALVTTAMTGPLLSLILRRGAKSEKSVAEVILD